MEDGTTGPFGIATHIAQETSAISNETRNSQREAASARLAAELLASAAYGSTAARVKAFIEQGGGCRATFFNHRRKLGGGSWSGNGAG